MINHYHYLVSYSFSCGNLSIGFGDMTITTLNKMNDILMSSLRKKVIESAKEQDEKITNISIVSIFPLECDCENEEN